MNHALAAAIARSPLKQRPEIRQKVQIILPTVCAQSVHAACGGGDLPAISGVATEIRRGTEVRWDFTMTPIPLSYAIQRLAENPKEHICYAE